MNCRARIPFKIEVTLLEALDHLELVSDHPVLFRVFLEIKREVAAHHGAGKFLSGQRSESLLHELEYYLLVRVIRGTY